VLSSRKDVPELHLTTRRLALRAFTYDDLDALASMLGDAAALTYWVPPLTRKESRSWIERNLRRYEDDGFGRCAIVLRATGVGRRLRTDRHLVEGRPEVELGWIVRRSHQGKGIATEAGAA
jgi:[ribosomal protein S5]-alanine N-acetyltransferase